MASRAYTDQAEAAREWFSAAELADLALPGLPADKRGLSRRAQDERWETRLGANGKQLVRPRAGRGGGSEYHLSLLPGEARLELARRGIADRPAPTAVQDVPALSSAGAWSWFERQTAKVQAEARRRLGIVAEVELLQQSGMTRTAAIAAVSAQHDKAKPATLWTWLEKIDGLSTCDRLPALAPRRAGGGKEAEIHPDLWQFYKSDVLRLAEPTLTSCYERTADFAQERGLSLPSERTFRRRLERDIDPAVIIRLRKGEEALRRSIPAQRRTVEHLRAMEVVNIDGHKFDVWVIPPEGGDPIRPIMVAIQDVRSSKIVGWRLGKTESTTLARLAVADMIEQFGIPNRMTCDNGRSFASKWFTGGIANRFRFKVQDDEPTGLLVALGVDINWAIPGRGQSKPIERAFRDLADRVSRAPLCQGAYTGPNPMAKPADAGTKAVPWEAFLAHVAQGVIKHNARTKRRGRDYAGRSFDQVFAETFTEIRKATPTHLRMALLAAEQVRVNRQTAELTLYGNRYWAEECGQHRGDLVTVRFDPENLHTAVHVYARTGEFLFTADLIADSAWGTVDGAKATGKRFADLRSRVRDGIEAEGLLSAEQLALLQAPAAPTPMPEPPVTRIARHRGQTAAALKLQPMPQREVQTQGEERIHRALFRLVGGDD